jgi:hypothetical protein
LSLTGAPTLTRWVHWTGTAPLAVLVAILVTAAATFITDGFAPHSLLEVFTEHNSQSLAAFAAFVGSAIAATWGITAACKYWEARSPSGIARRLTLGGVGLVIGMLSGQLSRFLSVDGVVASPFSEILKGTSNRNPPGGALIAQLQNEFHLDPLVVATALLFGTLFALRNWSRQADESRPARFRLRSLFATVFVAWFTGALFGVTSPTFLTWAAVVSSTVQLASVWRPAPVQPGRRLA